MDIVESILMINILELVCLFGILMILAIRSDREK